MPTLIHTSAELAEQGARDGTISLTELFELLAVAEAEQVEPQVIEAPSEAEVGKALALSEASRISLKTIPTELANVVLPGAPKLLSDDEAKTLVPLYADLKKAASALEAAEKAIKEAFHQHFDLQAPEGSERDGNGHFLTEGEIAVAGVEKKIVRGVNGGKAAGLTEADLAALENEGLIDHATYLSLTASVPATRTLAPEAKVLAVLRKRPELVRVLATKARLTAKSTAIRIAKNA